MEDFFRLIFTVSLVIQPRPFFFGHKGAKSDCCNGKDEGLCLSNGAAMKTLVLYVVLIYFADMVAILLLQ